ncbi:MAG: hypothetical protein GMKNLPBB_01972 [Myxococcota bacterium]|nr:hypothetical protein [Myxococcota bacterium]
MSDAPKLPENRPPMVVARSSREGLVSSPDWLKKASDFVEEVSRERAMNLNRIRELESQVAALEARVAEAGQTHQQLEILDGEIRRWTQRYLDKERESINLANLFRACIELHVSAGFSQVIHSLAGILSTMFSAAEVEIIVRHPVRPVFERCWPLVQGAPVVVELNAIAEQCIESGQIYVAAPERVTQSTLDGQPLVCAPLISAPGPVAVINILAFQSGKALFDKPERDMLELLAAHAVIAIQNARLFSGKLNQLSSLRRLIETVAESQAAEGMT